MLPSKSWQCMNTKRKKDKKDKQKKKIKIDVRDKQNN